MILIRKVGKTPPLIFYRRSVRREGILNFLENFKGGALREASFSGLGGMEWILDQSKQER